MKKLILVLSLVFAGLAYNNASAQVTPVSTPPAAKLLRFHVVANSDTAEDQQIKHHIRDVILAEMSPQLNQANSLREAKDLVRDKLPEMQALANAELKKAGFDYQAEADFGWYPFPTKSYGTFTLPAGEYEAVRIQLGQGAGKNWWCVLFPPLCFIDITQSLAANPGMLGTAALDVAKKHGIVERQNQTPVEIRFKTLEWLKALFN